MHDEDGVSFAALEQPLGFNGCIGDTREVPVVVFTRSGHVMMQNYYVQFTVRIQVLALGATRGDDKVVLN